MTGRSELCDRPAWRKRDQVVLTEALNVLTLAMCVCLDCKRMVTPTIASWSRNMELTVSLAELLNLRLDALHVQIKRLSDETQSEYLSLLHELQTQIPPESDETSDAFGLLDEIKAISKCLQFEMGVW